MTRGHLESAGSRPAGASGRPAETEPDAIRVALALARKLRCQRLLLLGCVRPELISSIPADWSLAGADAENVVAQATIPGDWAVGGPGELPPGLTGAATGAIILVSAQWMLGSDLLGAELIPLLRQAHAAVVFSVDAPLGLAAIAALQDRLVQAGAHVAHRTLVRGPGGRARDSPLLVACATTDNEVERHLGAGAFGVGLDPDVDLSTPPAGPLRVCVSSYEAVGPTKNAGIGTASTSLAHALARAGHDVTLLYTGSVVATAADRSRWEEMHRLAGVRFEMLDDSGPSPASPHFNVRRSLQLYHRLRSEEATDPFDIVHFPECNGHGYYAVQAKRLGLALNRTLLVTATRSPTMWCAEANGEQQALTLDAVVDDQLERRSAELADVVISPSAYMLEHVSQRGWKLPERRFVQQNVLARVARAPRPAAGSADHSRGSRESGITPAGAPDELVFFGRLEVRKGIVTFCDAIDELARRIPARELTITFLGRPEHVGREPAIDYVARRAAGWPWRHQLLGDLDRTAAVAYLKRPACLAVMPSTVDNSPNAVSEALGLHLRFITTRSGGTGELIDPLDLDRCTFPMPDTESDGSAVIRADGQSWSASARELADRLIVALGSEAEPPRPALDPDANERIWVAWHAAAAAAYRRQLPEPTGTPLDVESSDPPASIIRLGARPAHGTEGLEPGTGLLFVLEPGVEMRADAISTVQELAGRVGAEIFAWSGLDPQGRILPPLDGPPLAGVRYPAFACAGWAIRREAFARLGGFAAELPAAAQGPEFLNRAQLAGLDFAVIPDPLADIRTVDEWHPSRIATDLSSARPPQRPSPAGRPFSESLPASLRELPALHVHLARELATERLAAAARLQAESDERHRLAQYAAYLEGEHRLLSSDVHRLQASARSDRRWRRGGQRIPTPLRKASRRFIAAWQLLWGQR